MKRPPFGIRGLSAPSIDALHRRGLLDALLPATVPKTSIGATPRQGGHFAGIPFQEDDIDLARWPHRLPGSPPDLPPTTLIVDMQTLEGVLAWRAQGLGVRIERGVAVTGARQREDGVTVEAGGNAGTRSFDGTWLVGCDGARSRVRKAAGIDFVGTEPEFTGYSTLVDIADPEQLRPGRQVTAGGMYLQAQPGYVVIQDFDGGAFHDAGLAPTLDHVQAVLRRVSGTDVTLDALHLATTWTDRARQAERYRAGRYHGGRYHGGRYHGGRILLAGDAAHIHAPLGGQGLSLGLGDAVNLGWKLAATIHGAAPPGLLDTYEAERQPIGARVLDWSRAQVAAMRPDPGARALRAVLHDLMATRDGATYMAGRIRGIDMRYDLGAGHPWTGRSAPDLAFDDGTRLGAGLGAGLGTFMRGGRGVLFDLEGNEALAAFAARYGQAIDYVARRLDGTAGAAPAPAVGALLVRPDGIVAWACDRAPGGTPDLDGLRQAAGRWFVGGADA